MTGEMLNFMITPGDVDDRKPLDYKPFVEFLHGKLVGDKGYIGKQLFQRLFVDGIQLVTRLKSNMKGALMSMSDRVLTRKRAIIETINDELKNMHRWSIQDTGRLTTSSSTCREHWLHIASSLRNHALGVTECLTDN